MTDNMVTLYIEDFKNADAWQHVLDVANVPSEEQGEVTMLQFSIGGQVKWE